MDGNIPFVACRAETDGDAEAIRRVVVSAFGRPDEADLVDALRVDPRVWIDDLSVVAEDVTGNVVGYALLTRCRVGGRPALALAPCAVSPQLQNSGVGTAVTGHVLDRARVRASGRAAGENLVVVLGHPEFYPRFGFRRASDAGISATFEAPDDALMFLALDPARPIPAGVIGYPPAFGV